MQQNSFTKLTFLAIVFFICSCRKNPATETHTEPDKLTITDGSDARLPKQSPDYELGYGFPRDPNRQKTQGTITVAVIFVDYPDAPATMTPESVLNLMSPASEDFVSTVSHGKLKLLLQPKLKWYRMHKPSTGYGFDRLTFSLHQYYIQEAVSLADSEYDFSQTDEVLILSNPGASALARTSSFIGSPANGIAADGRVISNAVTYLSDIFVFKGLGFPHELGHSMGLPDLYNYSGSLHGNVGDFSIMGNVLGTAPVYNAWEQWEFGWFTDSQVVCVTGKGSGSQQLTPVETESGVKLLVFPIDATTAVIVEDRRTLGYDRNIEKEGPLAYVIDTKIGNGAGGIKVLPVNEDDQLKRSAPLSPGQSVTYKGIKIECKESGSGGSTVAYERQ